MNDPRQKRIDYIAQEIRNCLFKINGTDIGGGLYFKLVPPLYFESNKLNFRFQDTGGSIVGCTILIHPSGRSSVPHDVDHLTQSLIICFEHPKISDPYPYKWESFVLEKDDHEKILYEKGVCESLKYAIFHFLKHIHSKLYHY
ncbi:hypothetical protein Arcpr_1766 [Archaeoglobus profundus DSM 5631]|uniref:Uncharacterized protein n=1 Tax=Archaeoglobus profundus (strain DSM 5631 / JCM 9629 / NBRC 100127 / Av18) TaxID=572546 RepID=D2RFB6_ARCPA|nr:hypothetical protein Arcpr_1766 [Archaeoglobus profundus DSM 5631]